MILPRTPSFRLDGRHALVTGASSGIGLGAAVALAEAGAKVTLVARRADALTRVAAEMKAAGLTAEPLALDVTDLNAIGSALSERPAFDILVNAAGLARHGPALSTAPDDFDAVLNVNLRAAFFLTREVARRLIETDRPGSLMTISSQMGHVGGRERAVYCATKHGIEGMTKAMAVEWGPHRIRVNTICPTFIRTPLGEQTLRDPDKRRWIEGMIKLGRVGEIEDVMGAVVFLASEASALVTGSALMVDGGWTAD